MTDRETAAEQLAAGAVEQVKAKQEERGDSVITLSTGVKLRCNKISEMMVADIYSEFNKHRPSVPVYMSPKGREEPNPADPDYMDALKAWEIDAALALNNVLIIEGTEIVEVPDGIPKLDDPRWLSKMSAIGRPVDNEFLVYLQWIKYVAAPDVLEDARIILTEVARLSGIREGDVEIAVQNFPGES